MTHEHHEVVVEDRRSGSGMGVIVGIILIALLAVGIWYFALGPGQGTFSGTTEGGGDINVDVNLPSVEAPEN